MHVHAPNPISLNAFSRFVFIVLTASVFTSSLLGSGVGRVAGQEAKSMQSVDAAIEAIRNIQPEGRQFELAQQAAERLRKLPRDGVFKVFEAMRDTDVVAQNWFRGVAADIVRQSGPPSTNRLHAYIADTKNSDTGRAAAMTILRDVDRARYEELLGASLNDPSLLIREAAVAAQMQRIDDSANAPPSEVKVKLRETLAAARHPIQVSTLLKKLNDLGDPVTTADAFVMIGSWQSVGPFDNRGGIGFAAAYAPEESFENNGRIDLDAKYEGKNGTVSWKPVTASGSEGKVDLAAAYDKEKGAVAYVYTEFESDRDRRAQARLGCVCANQAWINGKQVMSNEVYHSGSMIDQYVAECELVKGTNRVLLKICQNEQTESWAQDWQFQFRLTDLTGKGLR